ncbi:hypothetical protein N7509_010708 [Penicillium cosmopolitanum]|uniref:Uncharacterized protein n=1 Tax=Penicillium cosmopolitanum TaxID=1131564 RepID=A0A9W9VRU3_9EURO|nr:uncharacterized protein N7509_010708 [Penicillium cosmopolitanum]KAJ5388167.1 hypothetical protein N7509_010708 [Penicillium cosmopolitanum]
MGQAISAMRESVKEADKIAEEKAKQELDILQKLVDSKLNEFQFEINERFLNPDATSKTQVPGIRALRWERRSLTKISDNPADSISETVDQFFSAGGEKTSNAVKEGFKGVVKTALNVFLGNVEVGEFSEEKFFVYMVHNTIIRVDVKLWRWNFSGEGFSSKYKSVLGYIMCISAVDPSKLHTAEFIYLISEYAGDDEENVNKYIDTMQKMYTAARKMKQNNRITEYAKDD